MRKIIIALFILLHNFVSSQIIKAEETYYSVTNEEKKYSTYHYVQSDYSSRPFQIFITNNQNFERVKTLISKIFSKKPKQDFTDIYVLGIYNFDKNQVCEIDRKIIDAYVDKINKYRAFYNLSVIEDRDFIAKNMIHFVSSEEDLCSYMICETKSKK
ncbi:hypothetical protein [Flavobacterium sp. DG2-3]|uniref:hypothetical protein n=1 Tax=Flavobacterium sp. DG2-3 TaxID=3068317 RepID=UPI00273E85EB|nr:hypothetical protein [Flavobacterium sp. DG2-3]MDP5201338.1 hypothetical protein [Flavobacterium sp. DG2-3]